MNIKPTKQESISLLLQDAKDKCKKLKEKKHCLEDLCHYIYSTKEAIVELGLDSDLIQQLVEDYVDQVIKTKYLFAEYIENLERAKNSKSPLDYKPIRELAHKNLGVAKNLRIKDSQSILEKIMHEEDIECLKDFLLALEICAIKLSPEAAYDAKVVIDTTNSIF